MKSAKEIIEKALTKKFNMSPIEKSERVYADVEVRFRKEKEQALKDQSEKINNLIEEVFSEGWYNYFHNSYGIDNESFNEKMIQDIDKKVKELKSLIKQS